MPISLISNYIVHISKFVRLHIHDTQIEFTVPKLKHYVRHKSVERFQLTPEPKQIAVSPLWSIELPCVRSPYLLFSFFLYYFF